MKIKIIIEKHADGYCGYPIGFTNGAIVGQGETYLEALQSTESSIQAFIDYYGKEELLKHFQGDYLPEDAFIAETGVVM
jgi:predicted RNase H-like HicB family nuclease